MTLFLLRHARTEAAAGLCIGRTDVTAVAEATQAAARRAADALPRGAACFTSPRRRCTALAEALAALRPDLAATTDPRLAEVDFGRWEGQAWSAIGRADFDAWRLDFADACPGLDGESTRAFMGRVAQAFDAWRASGRDTVWITHAGVMRAVLLLARGVRCPGQADEWPAQAIEFGACIEVAPP